MLELARFSKLAVPIVPIGILEPRSAISLLKGLGALQKPVSVCTLVVSGGMPQWNGPESGKACTSPRDSSAYP